MSRLSPDSLFHLTSCFENLLGILDNTFYPRYCYEEFNLVDKDKQQFAEDAFPMVCFCDIPLSQLMNHIEIYGRYGLGMTKEWGISKGLNPVIYFNKNSHMANRLSVVTNGLLWDTSPIAQAFYEVMLYMKPYKGILYRNGRVTKENIRFYDEHEWRYVPHRSVLKKNKIELSIQRHIYQQPEKLADANKKLETDETRLSFKADDIKYIIIEEERQINEMIGNLRDIKGSRYDSDTIDRLASRIITVKQIEGDF
ncbi:MAG TPA: abortive infection system antitoxin AbiGi family protein [Dehalococcoidia bacterium]|nr:abortive infection system antitoxin AbiGi family protein [Dehalococcoidia bacterium]